MFYRPEIPLTEKQLSEKKLREEWEAKLAKEGLHLISPKTIEKDWWREDLNRRTR
jgi:hypothetical protein